MPTSLLPMQRDFKLGQKPTLGPCEVEKIVSVDPKTGIIKEGVLEPGVIPWFLMRVHSPEAETWLAERMIGVPILFGGDTWCPVSTLKVDDLKKPGSNELFFVASERCPIGELNGLNLYDRTLLSDAVSKYLDGKQGKCKNTGNKWISWVHQSQAGTKLTYRSLEDGHEQSVEEGKADSQIVETLMECFIDLTKGLEVLAKDPQSVLRVSVSTIHKGGPNGGKSDADTNQGQ